MIFRLTAKIFQEFHLLIYSVIIITVFRPFVHKGIVNFFVKKVEKGIDFSYKNAIITQNCIFCLIKSGGGNGPMKPGNLSERMLVPNPAVNER